MTTTKYNPRQEYTARPKQLAGDIRRAEEKLKKAQRLFDIRLGDFESADSLAKQLEEAKKIKRIATRLEKRLEEVMTLHAYRDGVMTPKEERLAASDRYEAICKMEAERERREGR